jgi:hypothetical protein
MFTPDFYIDLIQSTKRTATNKIFKDEVLNKAANDFITGQTAFAKMLVNNTFALTQYSVDSISKVYFPKDETVKTETAKKSNTDIDTQGE